MSVSLTIEQIAGMARVSRSTVSRVLNNHPSVRPEVRDRVLQIINEQNYAPRAAARSLASSRTHVLGLLIPRSMQTIFSEPFFSLIIQGIVEECSAQGYFLTLWPVTAAQEQGFYHRILRAHHFDGLIMMSSDIDDPILPLLIKDRTPLVLIGRHPYFDELTWVDVLNREGARLAVNHLLQLGHRRIATIAGPLQMVAGMDRRDGYKQALLEAGIAIAPELLFEGDFTQESGYRCMQQLLALPKRPSAVMIASDTMAAGALLALRERGVDVPRELAVVGFDDLPTSAYTTPPLTTMHQPTDELGATAVRLLVAQLEQPEHAASHVLLPVTLVQRESCGATLPHRS